MSNTLYRKHRPQKFSDVVSQNHIKVTLQNEISSGKTTHAYLFSGPRGIGKTTVARILAKALNCQNLKVDSITDASKIEPCDDCPSCLEVVAGRSLDLVEIDAASNRGINEIRELREQAKYTPLKEKYKVFIIDEVHMLTNEAFNALLKTLEEPPAHAIFILATTEIHKIPDTIISRCQRFDFKKVPLNEALSHLQSVSKKEGFAVDAEVLESIARASGGYLRDSLSLLGQVLSLGENNITSELASLVLPKNNWQQLRLFISNLLAGKTKDNLVLLNELIEEGIDLENFAKNLVELLRQILVAKVTGDWQPLMWESGEDWVKTLTSDQAKINPADLVKIIEIFLIAVGDLKQSLIVSLPLEIALVKSSMIYGEEKPAEQSKSKNDDLPPPVVNNSASLNKTSKPSGTNRVKSALSLEIIKQKWPEAIEALKEFNHSLSTFLKAGVPIAVEDNRVVLGFEYNFHFERLKEAKNFSVIQDILQKVYGQPLDLVSKISPEYGQNAFDGASGKRNLVDVALETLGGELLS